LGSTIGIERDVYVMFFELFKKVNRQVEVRDVHSLIMELRMVKDEHEMELIKRASELCSRGMEAAMDTVEPGVSELEVAAETYHTLMKAGSRHPLVYVDAGPSVRIHAEPLPDVRIKRGYPVTVVVAADYGGYYADMTRTVFIGLPSEDAKKGLRRVHGGPPHCRGGTKARRNPGRSPEGPGEALQREGIRSQHGPRIHSRSLSTR